MIIQLISRVLRLKEQVNSMNKLNELISENNDNLREKLICFDEFNCGCESEDEIEKNRLENANQRIRRLEMPVIEMEEKEGVKGKEEC
jgi:hypothetical protein